MLLICIVNVLFIWIIPVHSSSFRGAFVSNKVRLLNDGNLMPLPAFGTAMGSDVGKLDQVPQAAYVAIENGFRHIDTAASYTSEDYLAVAIKKAISRGLVTRKDLFITTKLNLDVNRGKRVVKALLLALQRLQLDYVDAFLIHTPYNLLDKKRYDLLDIWTGMEEAQRLNLTKSIGVSNFEIVHLNQILPYCTTIPAVNQIEVNPTFTNSRLVQYCQDKGIMVTAYGAMGYTVPRPGVSNRPPPSLDDPVLVAIAKKYGVETSQVVLRYLVDLGTIPLTSSNNKVHVKLNVNIFNFSLTVEEVERISKFNIDRPVYGYKKEAIYQDYITRLEAANRRNKKLYPM